MWKSILKSNISCSKMFLCQTIHTALILEIGVILTPIGLAKLEQEFDTCIIGYSSKDHQSFQKCVFLHQTRKAWSQTVTMVRMWSDDIIQREWVSAPTQAWQRKELCFNIVHIVTGFIKGNTSGWQYVASLKPLELKAWVPPCCALWAEEHKPTSYAPGVLRTACPKFSASQSEWISPVAKVQLFWH